MRGHFVNVLIPFFNYLGAYCVSIHFVNYLKFLLRFLLSKSKVSHGTRLTEGLSSDLYQVKKAIEVKDSFPATGLLSKTWIKIRYMHDF